MAIGVACEVSVCRAWHICGGRIGSAHRRVGGACKRVGGACGRVCGACERVCVRDVVSLCGQAYNNSRQCIDNDPIS